jgi:urease accessory protein
MGWHGHLQLDYRHDSGRTTALDRHHGPLRVLRRLYPEGDAVCHHVLVHPPGGIVGGDVLELDATLQPGSHALITTPGATRFYRSAGPLAVQQVRATLAGGARLEWLPLETLAYRRCEAENRLRFTLAPGAQMIGWDVLALGLPAAEQPFDAGRFLQQLELPGIWLERGRIDGSDRALLDSPLGLAGHTVMATMWLADGGPLGRERTELLIDAARALIDASPLATTAGITATHESLLVLRVLAHRVEPAMALLQAVWRAWRPLHWGLAPCAPRVWRT